VNLQHRGLHRRSMLGKNFHLTVNAVVSWRDR
jgi:hypothetical protein